MKKTDFNILRFLLIFVALLEGFYIYVGITTTGGKLFSPFLGKYLNIPLWLTLIVSKSSAFFLKLAGYIVYENGVTNITIEGSRGVTIAWGCLGVGAMSLWIAFITAHRGGVTFKVKWILQGLILVFILNIGRIMVIVLSNYYRWANIRNFNAHTIFNFLTYVLILIMMFVFVRRYARYANTMQQKKS